MASQLTVEKLKEICKIANVTIGKRKADTIANLKRFFCEEIVDNPAPKKQEKAPKQEQLSDVDKFMNTKFCKKRLRYYLNREYLEKLLSRKEFLGVDCSGKLKAVKALQEVNLYELKEAFVMRVLVEDINKNGTQYNAVLVITCFADTCNLKRTGYELYLPSENMPKNAKNLFYHKDRAYPEATIYDIPL